MAIAYSMWKLKGKIETIDIINGVLGSLVAITAGCFLYEGKYEKELKILTQEIEKNESKCLLDNIFIFDFFLLELES